MISWLLDTFAYTALLIGLVLVLRRPVARHFGAQTAYALWALPLLRLVLPPIVLPASFAPEPVALPVTMMIPVETAQAVAAATPAVQEASIPWGAIVLAAWILGAVLFLGWRCWSYAKMREELLAGSRPVGEAGNIRLVETPAVDAPVAFGIFDKVVALPMEFMALEDQAARDFAIEHELAHHRGRDLLANIFAQPLLALHWFNPLAWLGWRAMRRDQEAACDARVISCRSAAERAQYGQVIASFAAGPRLALAAPMACPILGEKSIIHRLRSLKMSDVSPRRRIAGRLLLGGAVLALPLTASVSYAVETPPAAPSAPPAPAAPPAPPPPPAPPAPVADADGTHTFTWTSDDGGDGDKQVTVIVKKLRPGEAPKDGKPVVHKMVVRHADGASPVAVADGKKVKKFVVRTDSPLSEEDRAELEKLRKEMAANQQEMKAFADMHGKEWAEHWEKLGKQMEEKARQFELQWKDKDAPHAFAFASGTGADVDCGDGDEDVSTSTVDGKSIERRVVFCKRIALNSAREALKSARESVKRDKSIPDSVREDVLKSLDREIEKLDKDS